MGAIFPFTKSKPNEVGLILRGGMAKRVCFRACMKAKKREAHSDDGGVAQLGEHLPCKQGVSGSIPLISTTSSQNKAKAQRSGFGFERRSKEANEG